MSASELLARLDAMGVKLFAEDGRLKVNAARGALDESLRVAITEHKAGLLQLLQIREQARAPIAVLARGGDLPLSLFQERLWVLQRLDARSTAFLLQARWLAPAGAELAPVAAAVERAQARHESLRTIYVEEAGTPVARLVAPPPVERHDLSGRTPEAQQAWMDAQVEAAVHTPIDLAVGPVARFGVVALGAGRVAVLLATHHIAVDAWSIGALRAEIEADLAGRAVPAPPLEYADFAAWQRSANDTAALGAELDWWARTLDGAPQLSALPSDRTPASRTEGGGATVDFTWDAAFGSALREMAREEGVTVYMALLAACAALVRAHTGQSSVVLGSPMGVRERPELEAIVGPFVNLLVIRIELGDDTSFAELLRRTREALFEAHAHGQVPFEKLVERLKPPRSFDHGPLFQVAVVQHNASPRGDLAISSGGAMHDLTWFVRELDGGYEGSFEYRQDLYSPLAVARFERQLQQLLRSALADRARPVSRLSLLDAKERQRVLQDFNATRVDLDPTPFVRQFERQAAAAPARVALRSEGESLDYGELNRRANLLAHRLQEAGVAPGVLVAVCLPRAPLLLVTLLAVHKAGGAYVPLDPGFPPERLAYMVEDSGAPVLVTSGDAAEAFEPPAGVVRIDPQAEAEALGERDGVDLGPVGTGDDPAYVIYTSGSTGRPKGVVVPQRALSNFLGAMRTMPGLAADDVLAAVTTISFDIAGLELFLPLTVGATIELVSRETAADGIALADVLHTSGATVLQATPATWRLLLEADWRPKRPLRALCGGEGLPRELADAVLERVAELWNLYGPTETTVWSTAERVMPSPEPVTIGRPIANTQVYVLNAAHEPLPVGMAGELWIGGTGVALGYHRRPELTAERFVPDPFSSDPGARLYRTGDLGRWDEQGRLHHLGRIDHQVKVRGFRIELGEIESVLGAHPAIRQALVLAREAAPGDARLVAYVVYQPGEDLTVSDVRRHLRRELPDYMVPSVVVALDAFPSTPNGKVDRAGLPDPFHAALQARHDYEPPVGVLEETIAAAWREVLQIERVGAQDNFFELGGHSLLSLRVAAAVERATGWRMDPRLLFFQTLRQVAASGASRDGAGR